MKEKNLEKEAIIVTDLTYGDAGKGTITDFLSRELDVHTIIRYNGGAQAGHNVVTPEGIHHEFRQIGSGTFVKGVRTHLSRFMLVDPLFLLKEERQLQEKGITDAFSRVTVDRDSVVSTPLHQAVNRLKEVARNKDRHGSTGMGIGETRSDFLSFGDRVLFASDLSDETKSIGKLRFLREIQLEKIKLLRKDLPVTELVYRELRLLDDPKIEQILSETYSYFATKVNVVDSLYLERALKRPGKVIFEGAQGVLLDQLYGFYPYTTWTDTTSANAERLLSEANYSDRRTKLGIIRTYATRHGAGPFVSEDSDLTSKLPDEFNYKNDWQGGFRVGYFDLVSTRYAVQANGGIDQLAVTHLDRIRDVDEWKVANAYKIEVDLDNLGEYFEFKNNQIIGIKIPEPLVIDHLKRLTPLLKESSPLYEKPVSTGDLYGYLDYLQRNLGAPIRAVSFGPSSTEKCFFDSSLVERGLYGRVA